MASDAQLDLVRFTVALAGETDFAGWRDAARRLALAGVRPEDIGWRVGNELPSTVLPVLDPGVVLKVTKEFVERAETVFCHADPERFAFLYRLLWRLKSEPHLLSIASDPDIRRFEAMAKAVRRDIHKMRAFLRFREVAVEDGLRFVAWF